MTTLSPAAQAVLKAANSRNSYGPDDCLNESRWIAAAALRAAADQASPEKQVEDIQYVHQMYTDGMRDALSVIQEIADELEGAQ